MKTISIHEFERHMYYYFKHLPVRVINKFTKETVCYVLPSDDYYQKKAFAKKEKRGRPKGERKCPLHGGILVGERYTCGCKSWLK